MQRKITTLLFSLVLLLAAGCFPATDDSDGPRDGSTSDGGGSDGGGDGGTSDGGGANCGNGTIDLGEDCEAGQLNGSCESLGFAGGTLFCSGCLHDTGSCTALDTCGNGTLDTMEACEGFEVRGETCQSQGRPGGRIACTGQCTLDLSGCSRCGDGAIGDGEVCDTSNFNGATCESELGTNMVGPLFCVNNCGSIDSGDCYNAIGRDSSCDPRSDPDQCVPGTGCTNTNPFDAGAGQCLTPCTESSLGQRGPCPTGELCLRTSVAEAQPGSSSCSVPSDCNQAGGYTCLGSQSGQSVCGRFVTACGLEARVSGDLSSPGAWNSGDACTLEPNDGHNYCQQATGATPAQVICLDAGGSHPVCLGICDGEGGADLTCPSGTICQIPATMIFVIPEDDGTGNTIPCDGDPDCTTAGFTCVQLQAGPVCARAAKMCVNP